MWPSFPVWLASLPETQPRVRPAVHAGLLTLAYVVAAAGYILLSSQMAARVAGSVEELERLEQFKGTIFVMVTGAAFFLITFALLHGIRRRERDAAESTRALIQAERTALSALLARSIAHDIRNALVVAQMGMEEIGEAPDGIERRESAAVAMGALGVIDALAVRLMRVGREEASEVVDSFRALEPIEAAIRLVGDHRAVRAAHFTPSGGAIDAVAAGTPELISRSVVNLVINAAEAAGPGGRVALTWARAGDSLVIEVEDDGAGIADGHRDEIFDAFYSTKDRGSGLGLISVRACALQHGGSVDVEDSQELGGARFRLTLPILRDPGG